MDDDSISASNIAFRKYIIRSDNVGLKTSIKNCLKEFCGYTDIPTVDDLTGTIARIRSLNETATYMTEVQLEGSINTISKASSKLYEFFKNREEELEQPTLDAVNYEAPKRRRYHALFVEKTHEDFRRSNSSGIAMSRTVSDSGLYSIASSEQAEILQSFTSGMINKFESVNIPLVKTFRKITIYAAVKPDGMVVNVPASALITFVGICLFLKGLDCLNLEDYVEITKIDLDNHPHEPVPIESPEGIIEGKNYFITTSKDAKTFRKIKTNFDFELEALKIKEQEQTKRKQEEENTKRKQEEENTKRKQEEEKTKRKQEEEKTKRLKLLIGKGVDPKEALKLVENDGALKRI